MKTNRMLTIFSAWYLIEGLSVFVTAGGFYFMTYGFGIFCISISFLCFMIRNESPSRLRNAILFTCFMCTLGVSLIAYYAQWIGQNIDSLYGYIVPTIWLIVAIGFFDASRRSNALPRVRNLQ